MAKAKKRITPKRRMTTMDRVEMAQTGRKPKGWKTPAPKRKK